MLGLRNAILSLLFIAVTIPEATAKDYDVKILRDTWGVPHVYGKTDADAAYGLAWAQCEDNFVVLQESLMTSRGTMGAHTGQAGAMTDYIVALLKVNEFVEERYKKDLSKDLRKVLEGYAAGVNAFAAKYPEQLLRDDLVPVSGKDIAGGFVFRAPFFVGLDGAVRELFGDKRRREISTSTDIAQAVATFDPIDAFSVAHNYVSNGTEMGSNGHIVGPKRSADGSTMLLANPHLSWEGATTWYEVHMHSEEGWNMTGGLFAGSPIITLGHNENLGWTHTVNAPDLVDIYVLEMNPDNENQYRFDGKWLDLEESEVTLRVKVTDKMTMPVRRQVYESIHGPVMKSEHGVYAIRYAGWGDIRSPEQWYRMNKAKNLKEFKAAMSMRAIHSFNTIYADKDGNIWSLYNAMLPHRTEGYDYTKYLPGDTSETLWDTYLTLDELPQVLNPEIGFAQNNNSDPFMMSIGSDVPKREDYSYTHGIETRVTNRTLRALELFEADESVTWEEFEAYKWDLYYSKDSSAAKAREAILAVEGVDDPLLKEAVEVVRAWDLATHEDNTSAALAITTINQSRSKPETMMDTLLANAKKFKEVHGRLDIRWDTFNRIQKGSFDVGIGGGPDILHCVTPSYIEDGTRSKGRHGDGYTTIVKWDKDGNLTSKSLHQFGTSVEDDSSPHFADQIELMRTRTMKPIWFTEADIRANLEREYRPGE
jgi:acyl-homoserine-lactone acylase